jgi:hypothetical protein
VFRGGPPGGGGPPTSGSPHSALTVGADPTDSYATG